MFELYEKWQGLIPLCLGIVIALKAWGIFPRKRKNFKNDEEPFNKFNHVMKVGSLFLIALGLLFLFGILRN